MKCKMPREKRAELLEECFESGEMDPMEMNCVSACANFVKEKFEISTHANALAIVHAWQHLYDHSNLVDGRAVFAGRKQISEEDRKKLSGAMTGKHHTEEAKRKIGAAHKGKHVSEETREKIRKGKLNFHKGMTWRIVDGKRTWFEKEQV